MIITLQRLGLAIGAMRLLSVPGRGSGELLDHAVEGVTMHLGYEGVTTPLEAGSDTVNRPE